MYASVHQKSAVSHTVTCDLGFGPSISENLLGQNTFQRFLQYDYIGLWC